MLKKLHQFIKTNIFKIIDIFYPLFRKLMPLHTFRYAACGGGNTLLNFFIFFVSYNFILKKQLVELGFIVISPHIAAFIMAFLITFPIGFYLNLFVVFEGSYLKKRTQLFRYFLVTLISILLNYLFLKLFIEQFGWYPTPSMILSTSFVILFSYFSQINFSFKKNK